MENTQQHAIDATTVSQYSDISDELKKNIISFLPLESRAMLSMTNKASRDLVDKHKLDMVTEHLATE
jgi:hypothetical protein